MAFRRLREPGPQMRQALTVVKTVPVYETRLAELELLMLERGMPPEIAERRLVNAVTKFNPPQAAWDFPVAWDVCWDTIYWPHQTIARHEEQAALRFAREEYEAAWYGRPAGGTFALPNGGARSIVALAVLLEDREKLHDREVVDAVALA